LQKLQKNKKLGFDYFPSQGLKRLAYNKKCMQEENINKILRKISEYITPVKEVKIALLRANLMISGANLLKMVKSGK